MRTPPVTLHMYQDRMPVVVLPCFAVVGKMGYGTARRWFAPARGALPSFASCTSGMSISLAPPYPSRQLFVHFRVRVHEDRGLGFVPPAGPEKPLSLFRPAGG